MHFYSMTIIISSPIRLDVDCKITFSKIARKNMENLERVLKSLVWNKGEMRYFHRAHDLLIYEDIIV